MRDLKKLYIEPIAEITEFECEDIITSSNVKTLKKNLTDDGVTTFVDAGRVTWRDALGK